ncbi:MAG TPA: LOG family protein [Candidatus Limnocylindria bacterium]|nr:LOG family protein [Candidatus Limnocylindria bacterium]
MSSSSPIVTVFGSSTVTRDQRPYRLAYDLGRELARAGATVMTGGYSGVMEACSRGAHDAGGHIIGVTVELFEKRSPVNAWVKERVHTADLFERLRTMLVRADAFVTVPGSLGTLTELFLTWTLLSVEARPAAPLILLGDPWDPMLEALRHPELVTPGLFDHVRTTPDPVVAARLALAGVPERERA